MALIEVTQSKVEPDAVGTPVLSAEKYSRWGIDNKYPLHIIEKAKQDPVSMRAIGFKADAHYGKGPQLMKKIFEKGKTIFEPVDILGFPEIDDFFYQNDIENFLQSITQDYEWFERYHVEYRLNKSKSKILRVTSGYDDEGSVNTLRTKDIRKAKRDKQSGQMPGFYISGDWTEAKPLTKFIPSFRKSEPLRYARAMYEHKRTSISNDYYITPGWYSSLKWLEVTSKIPEWINSNIENSMNIKYHIQIPEKYFLDLYPRGQYADEALWQEAVSNAEFVLKQQLDDYLTGKKNVHKAFYSKFAVDEMGNIMPGWKIETVTNDLKDEAWLKADQAASVRILTAHGVDPTLAGIVIGNTSAGSGSDLREKFNYHMQLNTVIPRQTTTEWFEIVKRVNGWDKDLVIGYENIILDTLNNNKSGFQSQFEPTPTTAAK